jgi:transglutaminase-like putative cysteine protease
LTVAPSVPWIEYDDPFGNRTVEFELQQAYTELLITAECTVEIADLDPFPYTRPFRRPFFPLSWQPREQKLLAAYLTPFELPDHQIDRLHGYARSFSTRNGHDVINTLFDLNRTLFGEYVYSPGLTNHWTTPYDVFVTRAGVCQDFSNLFLCLARLLGVPARYVFGYVYTGNDRFPANQGECAPSDASHAWVQVYLPGLGWKSFDPTHGTIPRLDHVRVAHGRFPWDATPTSGVIFTPARERLAVSVDVRLADGWEAAPTRRAGERRAA